jgi:multidrug transporter EmrE-like cation transporter
MRQRRADQLGRRSNRLEQKDLDMKGVEILLVLLSVALSSFSQIVLKRGMTDVAVQAALAAGRPLDIGLAVAKSVYVVGGLTCFGLSAVVWLFVLSRIPLSQAYPFVSLGIVVTVVAGATLFGETLMWQTLVGVALIVVGVSLVGVSLRG